MRVTQNVHKQQEVEEGEAKRKKLARVVILSSAKSAYSLVLNKYILHSAICTMTRRVFIDNTIN